MATNDKPQAFPTWTSGEATQVAAPSPSQQASGFTEGQRPTYQLLNWLFWINGQWAQHLDSQSTSNTQYIVTNPLVRLLGGGLWSYDASSFNLVWSEDAYIAVPGIADAGNTVSAGSTRLAPGQVAYVEINPQASSNKTLQILVSNTEALNADINTVIIARCVSLAGYSSQVMVGVNAGQMVVRHGESKQLLGSGYVGLSRIKAGQPLSASQAVYVSTGATGGRTPGSVYPADAGAASGATRAKVAGFVVAACSSGDDALVALSGIVNNLTGLVPGGLVYLDPATPGAITQTIPTTIGTYVVPVGIALSATSMRINPAAAEMAVGLQSGLVVNGMLTVNGLSAFKPGAAGKTISLYDASGQTVVCTMDNNGAAVFAESVTTKNVQATTAMRAPSFVSTTGFKSNIYLGSSSENVQANSYALLLCASNNPRTITMSHSGSIIGISLSQYTGNSGQHSVRLFKNFAQIVTAANITQPRGQGNVDPQNGYVTFAKGLYTFAPGDAIFGMVSYSLSIALQVSVEMIVEYNA